MGCVIFLQENDESPKSVRCQAHEPRGMKGHGKARRTSKSPTEVKNAIDPSFSLPLSFRYLVWDEQLNSILTTKSFKIHHN